MRIRSTYCAFVGVALLSSASLLEGQIARRVPQITQPVSEARLATLNGNTRKEAVAANDLGRVEDSYALDHLHIQLRRSPEDEKAIEDFINQLHNPSSPFFHRWLTAAEVGQRFGLATEDVQAVTGWLKSRGFTVHGLSPDGMMVDFSGNAGLIRSAFRTELHRLNANGQSYVANMSDPRIPAALAPAIAGVVSLNTFKPQPNLKPRSNYTVNSSTQLLVPGDIATIYNLKPAFAAGISGQNQTIAVIEDSDLFSAADWVAFRNTLGLTTAYPQGSLTTVHPGGGSAGPCADPGANGDGGETTLDAEWASAAAPNAAIIVASCANTNTNFGGFIALENILTSSGTVPHPQVVSISFSDPESDLLAAGNAYVNSLYQLGVLEGISIFVSTGDTGAAVVDFTGAPATHGINTSGFATTPYNVAVGGTDYSDSVQGLNSTYWNATNAADFSSARSYISEIPWNDSCGSTVIAAFIGFPTTYGAGGLCNQAAAFGLSFLINDIAGSGGPSACATGTTAHLDVIGGTCKGYPKPTWQAGFAGIVNDGVRDIPDVSLFASNGIWGHYYVVCYSDPNPNFGGKPCVGAPSGWAGFGGTSVSTPIMAGIQTLVNQHAGGPQGNPAPTYYSLAAAEYGPSGNPNCRSNLGSAVSSSCIFYDVTAGDNNVPCGVSTNCYRPGGTITSLGVLSTSTTAYQPAFASGTGWDFATGIGSVNAFNLIMNWP